MHQSLSVEGLDELDALKVYIIKHCMNPSSDIFTPFIE